MEGPVEGEAGVIMGSDQFRLMLYVVPVLLIAWVVSCLGVNCWLLFALLICYLFWIDKQRWATERRRIQYEEKKKINAKRAMNEGETLRWLNEGLKAMWPICMEKFASQHFFKPMAPWFLNKYKPKFVREVTLLSLHLGSTPPEFSLIRILPASQDGDDVVFVAAMEFFSDKEMNAQMNVQIKGIKTTFYISKLYMKGTVKFSVKFLKGWPVLGRVRFSFEHTPTVTMTARPYNKNGIDMKIIPGAANWLEETLGTALEQSVVEPYMLVIDMERLVSNMMFPTPKSRQGLEDFFSVERKSATVLVEILEAGELKAVSGSGLPDPSVEVTLGAHKEKTKTMMKTTCPAWANEMQRIPIMNWELPNLLTLRVISKSKTYMGRQMELGICSISVKEYRDGSRHIEKLPLTIRNVSTGWLRFAITVEPQNNHSAHGVEKPHSCVGSQPTTQDIQTVSPPDSVATRKVASMTTHTRNSSTEDAEDAQLEDGGTSDVIKMPYGGDGAFSIQCPGQEETVSFPDHPVSSSSRKLKGDNNKGMGALDSKDRDADSKVKRSMMSILGLKKRSMSSRVSNEASPPEREMALSESTGYTSSLDRSTELKVYHGALRMNLQLSPDIASRDAPDVEPLKLETILSQTPEKVVSPQQPQLVGEVSTEKQNSKNSWWKSLTKRPRRRRGRSSSKADDVDALVLRGYGSSDTSASQSFRREPDESVWNHHDSSILATTGRSQSCRQDPSNVKRVVYNGAQSLRFDSSSSLLNTIHEKQRLQHD